MAKIILKVNNRKFSGWENISVTHSMTAFAGSFTVQATNLSFDKRMRYFGIHNGDEVRLEYNGRLMIYGHIDSIDVSYDGDSHSMTISGRDKTADLVDCSYVSRDVTVTLGGETKVVNNFFKKQNVLSVIKTLAKPFDITVKADPAVESILSSEIAKAANGGKFAISQGVSVSEEIAMLGGVYGFLALSRGDGDLYLTTAGNLLSPGKLKIGSKKGPGNIISGSMNSDDTNRFRSYVVKGQGGLSDFADLVDITEPQGIAEDIVARSVRTKVIIEEDLTDSGKAKIRAKWEARIRASNSRTFNYKVFGWSPFVDSDIWRINTLVEVKDAFFSIDTQYLISDITFSLGEGGEVVDMTLVPSASFDIKKRKIKAVSNGLDVLKGA